MSLRTLTVGVAVTAAAVGGALAAAAPAVAASAAPASVTPASGAHTSAQKVDFIAVSGAESDFYPTGEVLYVFDTAADGHHVVVYYKTSNHTSARSLADYDGKGTSKNVNLSIPETGWIQMNVCVAEGSTLIRCSGYSPRFSAGN